MPSISGVSGADDFAGEGRPVLPSRGIWAWVADGSIKRAKMKKAILTKDWALKGMVIY
jgi:hypothetical protein